MLWRQERVQDISSETQDISGSGNTTLGFSLAETTWMRLQVPRRTIFFLALSLVTLLVPLQGLPLMTNFLSSSFNQMSHCPLELMKKFLRYSHILRIRP